IHRDLKPSNVILVDESGERRPVVTDFGLAKPTEDSSAVFHSHTPVPVGSPYFMAPELLNGGRPTVASDVYALGLILDEMVTRTPAFASESLPALYSSKL